MIKLKLQKLMWSKCELDWQDLKVIASCQSACIHYTLTSFSNSWQHLNHSPLIWVCDCTARLVAVAALPL